MTTPQVHNYSTYVNYRCRCDVCRAANVTAQLNGRERRWARMTLGASLPGERPQAKTEPEHGKKSTYQNWLCRCDECVAVMRIYWRAQNQRRRHT